MEKNYQQFLNNLAAREYGGNYIVCFVLGLFIFLCLTSQAVGQEKQSVKLKCGNDFVEIICGRDKAAEKYNDRKCNKNKLIFTPQNGKISTPSIPKGFDTRHTAAGISCGRSKKGQYYVLVEYSNSVEPCGQCVTYELFETNGKRLTFNMKYLDKKIEKLGIVFPKEWIELP